MNAEEFEDRFLNLLIHPVNRLFKLERQSLPHPSQVAYGEPGAKVFTDDLFSSQGFIGSMVAPSLQSVESQPLIQGFIEEKCLVFRNEKKIKNSKIKFKKEVL